MELENKRVRHTIRQIGELTDLIGLRTYIIERTYGGREPDPEPWQNTRDYMQGHGERANTGQVIALFESAGCENETEAVRWLLQNDEFVS